MRWGGGVAAGEGGSWLRRDGARVSSGDVYARLRSDAGAARDGVSDGGAPGKVGSIDG